MNLAGSRQTVIELIAFIYIWAVVQMRQGADREPTGVPVSEPAIPLRLCQSIDTVGFTFVLCRAGSHKKLRQARGDRLQRWLWDLANAAKHSDSSGAEVAGRAQLRRNQVVCGWICIQVTHSALGLPAGRSRSTRSIRPRSSRVFCESKGSFHDGAPFGSPNRSSTWTGSNWYC